nr:unnamed protein product [Spirometra erinaceieuropaei]
MAIPVSLVFVGNAIQTNLFLAIKAVCDLPTKGTPPLLSADGGTLLTENTQIQQRRVEHFRSIFKRPSTISDVIVARLPQVETNADADLPPSLHEPEKCQEMQTHMYSTFVDLTKAFNTVNCDGLWKITRKFGCLERITQMVLQLHNGMIARATDDQAVSEAFAVTNRANQGCVLAPTLFSLMFSTMLMDA